MSLEIQLQNLLTRVGTEFKAVQTKIGSLAALTTTDKSSIIAALNELKGLVATAAIINDTTASASSTFSAAKINTLIAQAKSEIIGGADSAHDTLIEIQTLLNSDEGNISTLLTAIGNRVRFDAAQALTPEQKTQVLTNIGAVALSDIGNPNANLVTIFEAALV